MLFSGFMTEEQIETLLEDVAGLSVSVDSLRVVGWLVLGAICALAVFQGRGGK